MSNKKYAGKYDTYEEYVNSPEYAEAMEEAMTKFYTDGRYKD